MAAKQIKPPSETSTTILMLAYLCTWGYPIKQHSDKVETLDRFGLSDADIATVLGCTVKQVKASRKERSA